VQSLRSSELHAEHDPHVLFQASTIGALVDRAYEGDVTFSQLAEHGDLGLGTLNGLDGEMIALDGRFLRADLNGNVHEVDPGAKTPFAVMTWFEPQADFRVDGATTHDEFLALLDDRLPKGVAAAAVRIDGEFEYVRARSVPKQHPPYPPLDEVTANQNVFEFADATGTAMGFRFPDYAEGVEVSGYHLHFLRADGHRGGHVLECRPRYVRVRIDAATDLHLELPQGVSLDSEKVGRTTRDAIDRLEHFG